LQGKGCSRFCPYRSWIDEAQYEDKRGKGFGFHDTFIIVNFEVDFNLISLQICKDDKFACNIPQDMLKYRYRSILVSLNMELTYMSSTTTNGEKESSSDGDDDSLSDLDYDYFVELFSSQLNLSTLDVQNELAEGKSWWDIAYEQGLSLEDYYDVLEAIRHDIKVWIREKQHTTDIKIIKRELARLSEISQ
jgi:hypothetical protein